MSAGADSAGPPSKKLRQTVLSFDKPAKKPTGTNYSCTALSCVCFAQWL